jgi:lycopene cyclase domain-containing protein
MSVYLLVNILTLAFPLALSFDKRVAFFRQWKFLFPAIILTAAVFLVWDFVFTRNGVWEFNPEHVEGIWILGMPIEEWLFFFTVPYACVFIYACLKGWVSLPVNPKLIRRLFGSIGLVLILLAIVFHDRQYTFVNFLLAGLFSLITAWGMDPKDQTYLAVAYLISVIPFAIVNGLLTWLPVVVYNNAENLGIRAGSIPVEDFIYGFLLLMMNIFFLEKFRLLFGKPLTTKVHA